MQPRLDVGWQQPATGKIQDYLYLIWRDQIGGRSLRISLLLFFLLVVGVGVSFWRIPPQIPLAYSRPWGVAQLVPSNFLFVLVFLALFLLIANSVLASQFLASDQLLARMMLIVCSLTLFLFDLTVLRVILLIT